MIYRISLCHKCFDTAPFLEKIPLIMAIDSFVKFGWRISDDGRILCPRCAREEYKKCNRQHAVNTAPKKGAAMSDAGHRATTELGPELIVRASETDRLLEELVQVVNWLINEHLDRYNHYIAEQRDIDVVKRKLMEIEVRK